MILRVHCVDHVTIRRSGLFVLKIPNELKVFSHFANLRFGLSHLQGENISAAEFSKSSMSFYLSSCLPCMRKDIIQELILL